jgi:DNA invertase Pin-like site-specific DNA recombinase
MTAVGYVRRSKESGARTVSLDEQVAQIRRYAAEQGWELVEIASDDGVSGGKRARLTRLETLVRDHRARVVVVYHLDRFARDVAALLDAVRSYSRRGVELHVVGRGRVDVDTASGFLVTGVEGLMAEHFRRLIGEKTRDALANLRARGRRYSHIAPYGWCASAEGQRLEPEPKEQAALALIRQLAPAHSLRALSAALAERGVVARNGKAFEPKTLSRLVADRTIGHSAVA